MTRSVSRSRAGSARRSIALIFSPVIVKLKITRGFPLVAHTAPATPLMSASRAARARPEKFPATAAAPRATQPSAPIRAAV